MKCKFQTLILVVIAFISICFSVPCASETTPDSVIKKYYQADLEGARLSAEGYRRIAPLITWENEPGWDLVFVTKNAKIDKTKKVTNNQFHITVLYDVVGILSGDDLLKINFTEVVTFVLIKTHTHWKIKQPVIWPHASPAALIKNLEKIIGGNKDKARETELRGLIERLRAL